MASSGIAGVGGRMIRAGGPGALLPRILSEIDETLLPRQVTLAAGNDRSVVLSVTNGRVLRVNAVDGVADPEGLTGETLEPGDAQAMASLKALFEDLAGDEDQVLVRQETVIDDLDAAQAGLSAESLAKAWETSFVPADLSEGEELAGAAIDTFLQATQDVVTAWLMTGPETSESEGAGPADAVDELTAFAEARRETGEASKHITDAKDEPWSFLVLRRGAEAADVTVIVAVDGILLYLSVGQEHLGKVADAWRMAVPA